MDPSNAATSTWNHCRVQPSNTPTAIARLTLTVMPTPQVSEEAFGRRWSKRKPTTNENATAINHQSTTDEMRHSWIGVP